MKRALVLGGGGLTGIAWEIGVLVGLRRAGVDLSDADLMVGTSAGAVVGALLATGVSPEDAVSFASGEDPDGLSLQVDMTLVAQAFGIMSDRMLNPGEARARVGALALRAPVGDAEIQVERFAARLPVHQWPGAPRLLITAVDAETGEAAAWDSGADVPLTRAVAASCAVPCVFPPVAINGSRYMDGGVRSVTNADLAAGAEAVVVIAPTVGMLRGLPEAELRELGEARTVVISPDPAARAAIGPNVLDDSRRVPALSAGLAQGGRLVELLAPVWR
jgi:NTE family protein